MIWRGSGAARLRETLRDDAPAPTKDGGFVRPGVSAELDELHAISNGGREGLATIEQRERERTGIASLKIKSNSVFGFYIEVTRSHLGRVPDDYIRKQTVANAERFVTAELGDYEAKILNADERRVIALELEIFTALRDEVAGGRPGCWRWRRAWRRWTCWRRWPRWRIAGLLPPPDRRFGPDRHRRWPASWWWSACARRAASCPTMSGSIPRTTRS